MNMLDQLQLRLSDGATDLFIRMAAAHVAAGTGGERRFLLTRAMGGTFLRPVWDGSQTIPSFDTGWLDDMVSAGLLVRVRVGSRTAESFRVTALGERFYNRRRQLAGQAIDQTQEDVVGVVDGDAFARRHPVVGERLGRVLSQLRGGDRSADTIRSVGLELRHVLMDLAAEGDPHGDPEKPAERLRSLKERIAAAGEERQAVAVDALVGLVAAVLRVDQGAAHIKQRPDRIDSYDELRRAVFLTVFTAYEIDALLENVKSSL